MDFLETLHWRVAAKEFSEKQVPESDITYLMEAIRLAPSSFNVQPWHIVVVRDKELLQRFLPVMYQQPQVATTHCIFVFCANNNFEDAFGKVLTSMREDGTYNEGYEQAVRGSIGQFSEHQFAEYAQRQLYIALGFMLAAAAAKKIDAGPMEGIDRHGVAKVLGLPSHLVPYAAVAIGYRKNDPHRKKSRLANEQIFELRSAP